MRITGFRSGKQFVDRLILNLPDQVQQGELQDAELFLGKNISHRTTQ